LCLRRNVERVPMKCEVELSTNRMLVDVANDPRLSKDTKSSVDVTMVDVVNQIIMKRMMLDRRNLL